MSLMQNVSVLSIVMLNVLVSRQQLSYPDEFVLFDLLEFIRILQIGGRVQIFLLGSRFQNFFFVVADGKVKYARVFVFRKFL